jgi:hypothetical protein
VNVACVVLRPKVSSQVVQVVSVEVAPFAAPGTGACTLFYYIVCVA